MHEMFLPSNEMAINRIGIERSTTHTVQKRKNKNQNNRRQRTCTKSKKKKNNTTMTVSLSLQFNIVRADVCSEVCSVSGLHF